MEDLSGRLDLAMDWSATPEEIESTRLHLLFVRRMVNHLWWDVLTEVCNVLDESPVVPGKSSRETRKMGYYTREDQINKLRELKPKVFSKEPTTKFFTFQS